MFQPALWMGTAIALSLVSVLPAPVFAQSIVPAVDGTGTIITTNGNTHQIEGGTQTGTNLFHSFAALGLNSGEIANFLSNPSISHIFGRVTGGAPSVLNGLIQVTGASSNLYLMNPAGVVFGAEARLNLGGDFIVTTSDRLGFDNGWFNATGINDYARLEGVPHQFAFLSEQPGAILNFGELITEQNVSLMGGTVLNQGMIASTQGHVTLAAVPGERLVRMGEPGMLLSLEVAEGAIATGVQPLDVPRLLTGAVASTGEFPRPNSGPLHTGDLTLDGTVSAQHLDLYAAGLVTLTDADWVQGAARVVRFSATGANPNQAVFIDETVEDAHTLLYGATAGTVSQLIGAEDNGVAAVGAALAAIAAAVGKLDGVAIATEGNGGNFWLGNAFLSQPHLSQYQAQLQRWRGSLQPSADLLLYSCFTALGEVGDTFVEGLAAATGLDVAASVDLTGAAQSGGNWALEVETGQIETGSAFTPQTQAAYQGTLDTLTVQEIADDTTTGTTNSDGRLNLREALYAANSNIMVETQTASGTDTIRFDPNLFPGVQTITLNNGELEISEDVIITGTGQTNLLISGHNASRVFNISAANVTIQDLTVTNGRFVGGGGGGGGINNTGAGTLTLNNVTVSNNYASAPGGAIYSDGMVEMSNATLSNNTTTGNGGGIAGTNAIMLNNVAVSNNDAARGGGIASSGTLSLSNSTVSNNNAGGNGGGVYAQNTLTLTNTTVSGNSTADQGGGLWSNNTITLTTSTVSSNIADGGEGGGIFGGANITLTDSTVAGNRANNQEGGGIFADQGLLTLDRATIAGNVTSVYGGGIYTNGAATLTNTTVSSNYAGGNGGGIYSTGVGVLNIRQTTIAANTTTSNGGGIAIRTVPGMPNHQILNTIVANNQNDLGNATDINADLSNTTVRSSLITSTTGITGQTLSTGGNGNLIGSDPLLGPLQNNGGVTATHALRSGSPAIDAGDNGLVTVSIDQTGNARIANGVVDLGAYEFQVTASQNSNPAHRNPSSVSGHPNLGGSLPTSCLDLGCGVTLVSPIAAPQPLDAAPVLAPSPDDVPSAIDALETAETRLTQDYATLLAEHFRLSVSNTQQIQERLNTKHQNPTWTFTAPAEPLLTQRIWQYAELIDDVVDVSGVSAELIATIIAKEGLLEMVIERSEVFDLEAIRGFSIQRAVEVQNILPMLQALQTEAGIQPALIYFTFAPRSGIETTGGDDELRLILMTPESYPEVIPMAGVTREMVTQQVRRFRRGLNTVQGDRYLEPAQQLYDWLIRPLRSQIEAIGIDNLAIIPDTSLRSLPVAALHDGDRFLVEDYSLGLLPSLSLIDWRYQALQEANVLAMGASEFRHQTPLPAVPLELALISQQRQPFLNEHFTYDVLERQTDNRQFQILHLATHAQFQAGAADAAYIQLWGDEALQLKDLRNFGLYNTPPVELLILSACETAIGDAEAELGFAGSALQAGVKSVLASLWQVSDLGTLALMKQLYDQLGNPDVSIKAVALQQAQLALLRGEMSLAAGELNGVPLPPELAQFANTNLSHPYYWSAFTLVGSPW